MDEGWSLRKAGLREGVRGVRKEEKERKDKVVLTELIATFKDTA